MNRCLLVVCYCGLAAGCGDGGEAGARDGGADARETPPGANYTGPGSFYEASIGEQTFEITIADVVGDEPHTILTGDVERTEAGFAVLTLQSADGAGSAGYQKDDRAIVLEAPGFAAFMKPLSGPEWIPMLISGKCPEDGFQGNWLTVQGHAGSSALDNRDFWGTTNYAPAPANEFDVLQKRNLSDLALTGEPDDVISEVGCDEGRISLRESGNLIGNFWLTASGASMVETFDGDGQRDGTIFSLPAESVALGDVTGTYATLVYQPAKDEPVVEAVATWDADGGATLQTVTDVMTGETSGDALEIAVGPANQPSSGWLTGTVSSLSGSGNLVCAAAPDVAGGSSAVILCLGQNPDDTSEVLSAIMVAN